MMVKSTQSAQRALFSPVFVLSVLALLIAGLGLRPASQALIRYYSKEPIALRKSLDEFQDAHLPSFRYQPVRGAFGALADTEELGTDDWLNLVFEERGGGGPGEAPGKALLFVTYYSDPRDQIPHTPEVCYRQGGAVVEGISTVPVELPDLAPEISEIQARRLEIDQGGRKQILLYVFCCNGKFYHDREQVRIAIGWPGDKYTYFSKVEVVTPWPVGVDGQIPTERCQQLLSEAIPILVNEYFPRKEDLKRR
jgi:hypothetical protein